MLMYSVVLSMICCILIFYSCIFSSQIKIFRLVWFVVLNSRKCAWNRFEVGIVTSVGNELQNYVWVMVALVKGLVNLVQKNKIQNAK